MSKKPVIAMPIGDASGIGPEVVAKLAAAGLLWKYCNPIIIGDEKVLQDGFRVAGESTPYRVITDPEQAVWNDGEIVLLHIEHPELESVVPGRVNPQCGKACVTMIEKAVELCKAGHAQGICYAPLNKGAMLEGGCPTKSELELFALLLEHHEICCEINMVDGVWTTRVTSHIPIKKVSDALTAEGILDNIRLADKVLKQAGIENPRIGVAALNPHAGESGLCGREEIDVILPAITEAKKEGIIASGPYPSDILFIKAFGGELDAGVTMYHDQGQIALKLKGFERGITIGGGLAVPITTCAHGTAFDIVGKGVAGITSLENAIRTVSDMAK